MLDPAAVQDRRTEAEKRAEAHFLKYEEQRARKSAAKSHRERIKELNGARGGGRAGAGEGRGGCCGLRMRGWRCTRVRLTSVPPLLPPCCRQAGHADGASRPLQCLIHALRQCSTPCCCLGAWRRRAPVPAAEDRTPDPRPPALVPHLAACHVTLESDGRLRAWWLKLHPVGSASSSSERARRCTQQTVPDQQGECVCVCVCVRGSRHLSIM